MTRWICSTADERDVHVKAMMSFLQVLSKGRGPTIRALIETQKITREREAGGSRRLVRPRALDV
jgi:hypothetical protein